MTETEEARKFIKEGPYRDIQKLLRKFTSKQTTESLVATALLFEDMYDGDTLNILLKQPSAYSLIAWGRHGLDALVESAIRTNTTKNRSITFEILSTLASNESPLFLHLEDVELRARILRTISEPPGLSDYSRLLLSKYIRSFEDESDMLLGLSNLMQKGFLSDNTQIVKTAFNGIAGRWLRIGRPTLDEYQRIIEQKPDDESIFQAFFESNTQILEPLSYQVWSRPDILGHREPDFVIRKADDTYLVVEIENPKKKLVTDSNQISAETTHAITQAIDYRNYLIENRLKIITHFPEFTDPECLVVIGLENQLNLEQKKVLQLENTVRHRVRIVGFDYLHERTQALFSNTVLPPQLMEKLQVT